MACFLPGSLFFIAVQVIHIPLVLVKQDLLHLVLLPFGRTTALASLAVYPGFIAL